jgi:hypothetical protein
MSATKRWRQALYACALAALFVVGCVTGRGQPHMQSALDQLEAARSELRAARADKGGHRMRAIELIDRAIDEVQLGMDYGSGSR